jgi:hypothetical protein
MSDILGSSARARRGLRAIGALAFVTVAFAAAAGSALAAQVNIVRQGAPPSAVPATAAGSWVLIEAGVYHEAAKVSSAHSGIWIRGMNRNTVILDGQNEPGNGIEIEQAEQRLGGKPHGAELRHRLRRVRQRDLVERRRGLQQNRCPRLVRQLPDHI